MKRIDVMIKWVLDIIASGKYKYSQDANKRWGNGYYDCSSLMITALKQIGIDVHGATYTGNMSNIGKSADVEIFKFGTKTLNKGDILFWHKTSNVGHTAMYIGNNQLAEASGTKTGLRLVPYHTNNWQYVIRVINNYDMDNPNEKVEANNVRLGLFPEIAKGSKNVYVGVAQTILKWCVDETVVVDNSFGSHTESALRQFYINCGVPVSNKITKQFWELAERTLEQFA